MNFFMKYHDLLRAADDNRNVLSTLDVLSRWVDTAGNVPVKVTIASATGAIGTVEARLPLVQSELKAFLGKLSMKSEADFHRIVEELSKLEP